MRDSFCRDRVRSHHGPAQDAEVKGLRERKGQMWKTQAGPRVTNVGSHRTPSVGWSYHGDGWQQIRWDLGQQCEKSGGAAGALGVLLGEEGEAQGYRWPRKAVGMCQD